MRYGIKESTHSTSITMDNNNTDSIYRFITKL